MAEPKVMDSTKDSMEISTADKTALDDKVALATPAVSAASSVASENKTTSTTSVASPDNKLAASSANEASSVTSSASSSVNEAFSAASSATPSGDELSSAASSDKAESDSNLVAEAHLATQAQTDTNQATQPIPASQSVKTTQSVKASQVKKATVDPWADEDEPVSKVVRDPKLQRLAENSAMQQLNQGKVVMALLMFLVAITLIAMSIGLLFGSAGGVEQVDSASVSANMSVSSNISDDVSSNTSAVVSTTWYSQLGVWGNALWYGLSALAGGLALLVPVNIYYRIGRKNMNAQHAGFAIYDLLRAEVLKYGLIIVILGCCFKYAHLNGIVMMISFVIITFMEIGLRLFALPKMDPELKQYLQQRKEQAQAKGKE